MSAEVLRRAALRPDAPPRLLRAADAVLDGKFSWAEVASGHCAHPIALALFTPKAHETLWPLLRGVADEIDSADVEREKPASTRETGADDDYYAHFRVLRPAPE
jgi:hypothetical protein